MIADGRLLDLIRRVYCFGMSLLKLDLRQESTRHADTLDAVTTYLGYGSYKSWDEDTKCEFLTRELETKRPLIPLTMPMTDEVREGGQGRLNAPAVGLAVAVCGLLGDVCSALLGMITAATCQQTNPVLQLVAPSC